MRGSPGGKPSPQGPRLWLHSGRTGRLRDPQALWALGVQKLALISAQRLAPAALHQFSSPGLVVHVPAPSDPRLDRRPLTTVFGSAGRANVGHRRSLHRRQLVDMAVHVVAE
jgi:hypothetical protein